MSECTANDARDRASCSGAIVGYEAQVESNGFTRSATVARHITMRGNQAVVTEAKQTPGKTRPFNESLEKRLRNMMLRFNRRDR